MYNLQTTPYDIKNEWSKIHQIAYDELAATQIFLDKFIATEQLEELYLELGREDENEQFRPVNRMLKNYHKALSFKSTYKFNQSNLSLSHLVDVSPYYANFCPFFAFLFKKIGATLQ